MPHTNMGPRILEQAGWGLWLMSLVCLVGVFSYFSKEYSLQNTGRLVFSNAGQLSLIGDEARPMQSFYDTNDPNDQMGKLVLGQDLLIFYNAIPKTGSRSLDNAVVRSIAAKKPFEKQSNLTFQLIPPEAFAASELLNKFVRSRSIPTYIRGHAMYDVFESVFRIVYINAVRDPVERVISNYYFDVFGDNSSTATHGGENWPETIDECIQIPTHPCNDAIDYYRAVTLRQFCGMEDACRTVSRWTLERAKVNAQRYTVVGLTSDMEATVKALQMLVPDLLDGILPHYQQYRDEFRDTTKTIQKPKPQPQTVQILRQQMMLQYEFYEFLSARFRRLKQLLDIS